MEFWNKAYIGIVYFFWEALCLKSIMTKRDDGVAHYTSIFLVEERVKAIWPKSFERFKRKMALILLVVRGSSKEVRSKFLIIGLFSMIWDRFVTLWEFRNIDWEYVTTWLRIA